MTRHRSGISRAKPFRPICEIEPHGSYQNHSSKTGTHLVCGIECYGTYQKSFEQKRIAPNLRDRTPSGTYQTSPIKKSIN